MDTQKDRILALFGGVRPGARAMECTPKIFYRWGDTIPWDRVPMVMRGARKAGVDTEAVHRVLHVRGGKCPVCDWPDLDELADGTKR